MLAGDNLTVKRANGSSFGVQLPPQETERAKLKYDWSRVKQKRDKNRWFFLLSS